MTHKNRKPKKAVFFNCPAYGHVNPTLGLVKELVQQGEEIHYYCSEEFRDKIEAAGAVFHLLPFDILPEYSKNFHVVQVIGDILEKSKEMLPSLLSEIEAARYDYIISDFFAFWGAIISLKTGLKTVIVRPVFAMHKEIKHPKKFKSDLWKTPFKTIRQVLRTLSLFNYLKRQYKLPKLDIKSMFEDWLPNTLVLVCTDIRFQPRAELFDPQQYKFIGSSIEARNEQTSNFPMHLILQDRPLVLISLGSILNNKPAFFKCCIEAFRNSPFQVVMSVGNQIDIPSLNLPDNFIAWSFIPQLTLLQKAAIFITHGGMNSAVEGIMNEVPMLVIPQVSDQFLVAQELERCGVGLWMREKPTAVRLQNWTEKLFKDEQIHQNLAALKHAFVNAGGAQRGAEEVLNFVNE